MRKLIIAALFVVALPLRAAESELNFARAMLDDAIIRNDVAGIDLARGRILQVAADADDRNVVRDAYYLAALSALFESFTGECDVRRCAKVVTDGIRHADRAIEIDPQFADAWVIAAMLRSGAVRWGVIPPKDPPGTPNRLMHAMQLDPKSPPVAFFNALIHSFNPAGAAPPEGVKLFDDLVERLDAERAATGRPFALWDAEAHAWQVMVRRASDDPRAETLRPMAAKVIALRPDFELGQNIAASVAERKFVAPPSVAWQPFLTDAANDGKDPKLPDVISVERAADSDRLWFRITFREALPRSFGTNLVINRNGDSSGMRWWGTGSTFTFDRLVTAYISRDGDRYFGNVGVTDDVGARGARLTKISTDVSIAMGDDNRSVMIGVPRAALDLTPKSAMLVAGGSNLIWNDDTPAALISPEAPTPPAH